VKLWRIAASTRSHAADDLSGAGAAKRPGRWNAEGEPVVYCAAVASLAVLETAAHVDSAGLPLNRFLIEIDVPAATWARRKTLRAASLDASWAAVPAGLVSVRAGSAWLKSNSSALLQVPSVIVPEEFATLINPAHPDAAGITARVVRRFGYELLFRA
jgi:RES domain-containing protein